MTQLYAILAGIGAIIGAALVSYLKGRADAKALARARNDQTYINERKAADNADTGGGATDSERIIRLNDFAHRQKY